MILFIVRMMNLKNSYEPLKVKRRKLNCVTVAVTVVVILISAVKVKIRLKVKFQFDQERSERKVLYHHPLFQGPHKRLIHLALKHLKKLNLHKVNHKTHQYLLQNHRVLLHQLGVRKNQHSKITKQKRSNPQLQTQKQH